MFINNLSENIDKVSFVFADILCHYIGDIYSESNMDNWFPVTYFHGEYRLYDFFIRLTSKRHFDKVKGLFSVKDENEFKELLNKYAISKKGKSKTSYGYGCRDEVPFLFDIIDIENLAINR